MPDDELIPEHAPPCPYCGRDRMAWWPDPDWPDGGFWECPRCNGELLP